MKTSSLKLQLKQWLLVLPILLSFISEFLEVRSVITAVAFFLLFAFVRFSVVPRVKLDFAMFVGLTGGLGVFAGYLLNGSFSVLVSGGMNLMLIWVFYDLFGRLNLPRKSDLIKMMSNVYVFLLFFLLIEWVFIFTGMQPFLADWIPGYKEYNNNNLENFHRIFTGFGGPNSILIGSQIAGLICLASSILHWFLLRTSLNSREGNWYFFVLLTSLIMFFGSASVTIFLLSALAMFVIACWYRSFRLWAILILGGSIVLFLMFENDLLITRVFNLRPVNLSSRELVHFDKLGILNEVLSMNTLQYYMFHLSNPFFVWASLPIDQMLLGVGRSVFVLPGKYVSGESAIGIALLSSGLIWILLFLMAMAPILLPKLLDPLFRDRKHFICNWLDPVSSLLALIFLMSGLHYGHVFYSFGAMAIFACHSAIAITPSRPLT